MTVISDTSPLSALASIDRLELLPKLFGRIIVPREVLSECLHPGAPRALREWALSIPPWVLAREAPLTIPPAIAGLDPGETAALSIASLSPRPVLLLMDERKGIKAAGRLGLPFVGTLGLLVKGHRQNHLDFETSLAALRRIRFHLGESAILQARRQLASPPPPAPGP